jgi:hypothetical protein
MNARQHNNLNRVRVALALFVATFACATSQPAMAELPDVSQYYTIQAIEPPQGATDISFFEGNEAGLVVMQYTAGGRTHTGLLEKGTWTVIDVPGSAWCGCSNPSASGHVGLTFAHTDGGWHSAIYDGGTYQYLPDHPVYQYMLQYMSDNGLLMSGAARLPGESGVFHGLVLNVSLSLFKLFDFPGSKSTVPMGINNAGLIVGSYQIGGYNVGPVQGFLYDGTDFTDIQVPGASQTGPLSINNNGDIVGGYEPNDGRNLWGGFILHKGEWKRFAVPGCSGSSVYSITDGGQLAGIYTDRNGKHGFIATPRVDFNYDGKVDIQDLMVVIEHWGQSYPLCDIGPTPWGDGKVDANDLQVLMRYWGQEMDLRNPTLMAYWRLDETEGTAALDTLARNDGTLNGNPVWQPAGGKVGGALQLDGQDDSVTTGLVLDPSQGPFSVLAWVKGGAPGRVIVAQENGANWLKAAAKGELGTELKSARGGPLVSAAIVTDGAWHRVGLVWDGSHRILYVDGVEVAQGTPPGALTSATGGLIFGGPANATSGTFWSGLIDDVRLYNGVVKP